MGEGPVAVSTGNVAMRQRGRLCCASANDKSCYARYLRCSGPCLTLIWDLTTALPVLGCEVRLHLS